MTVTTFVSVKGAPGVTTLACLVGATWPEHRRVAVVEADPFGGDLAARFQLSVARGWTSYLTACRRSEKRVPLEPHLQALPGGLDVMIGARGGHPVGTERAVEALLASCVSSHPAPWDLIVDAGRLPFDDPGGGAAVWLARSGVVLVVTRRDGPSILKVRDRSPALVDLCGDRVGLVVAGSGHHLNSDIEEFTGLPVYGEVPFDLTAAQVASGERGSARKLSRSLLVVSARRLAVALAGPTEKVDESDDIAVDEADVRAASVPVTRSPRRLRNLLHRRLTAQSDGVSYRLGASGPGAVGLRPSQQVLQTERDQQNEMPGDQPRVEEQLEETEPDGAQQGAVL
jgi:hypothetical protein